MSMCHDCPRIDCTAPRAVCCLEKIRTFPDLIDAADGYAQQAEARTRDMARSQTSSDPRNRHERRKAAKILQERKAS